MYNQRKEDKCHRIAAFGGETGAGSVEGRGLFAGATVAGVHAEITGLQEGFDGARGSIGFQEKLFVGIGNNMGRAKFDDNNNIVRMELWMPTLGRFGHLTFGDQYDVSSKGIRKMQLGEIKSMLQNSLDPEDIAVVDRLNFFLEEGNEKEKITTIDFLRIGRALRRNGFEPVDRLGDHADGATKFTFRKAGSREYGQHEFMSIVMEDKAYCSYNYGNNFITHFLIDYLGWKGRGN